MKIISQQPLSHPCHPPWSSYAENSLSKYHTAHLSKARDNRHPKHPNFKMKNLIISLLPYFSCVCECHQDLHSHRASSSEEWQKQHDNVALCNTYIWMCKKDSERHENENCNFHFGEKIAACKPYHDASLSGQHRNHGAHLCPSSFPYLCLYSDPCDDAYASCAPCPFPYLCPCASYASSPCLWTHFSIFHQWWESPFLPVI